MGLGALLGAGGWGVCVWDDAVSSTVRVQLTHVTSTPTNQPTNRPTNRPTDQPTNPPTITSDWLPEEYSSLLTARRNTSPTAALKSRSLGTFTAAGISKDSLPREVDWRGKIEDGIVKDQATCGSCWVSVAGGSEAFRVEKGLGWRGVGLCF